MQSTEGTGTGQTAADGSHSSNPWDPSLAVVMAAALIVMRIGVEIVQQRGRPFVAEKCDWPTKTRIDAPLVFGAMLFGVG